MDSRKACRTLWLADKVLGRLRCPLEVSDRPWCRNPSLLSEIRSLADEAGGVGVPVVVAIFGQSPQPFVVDLGTGSPSAPRPVGEESFPLGAPPPRNGRMLLLTIDGDGPVRAALRIETFEDGRRHGFLPDSPAGVEATADGFSAGYYFRDVDVSDLGNSQLASMRDLGAGCTGPARDLVVDPRHETAFRAVVSAEDRGEAVAVSAVSLPGLHIVRQPGAATYQLADDAALDAARKCWEGHDAAALFVRVDNRAGPQSCSVVRKVGSLVDGAMPMSPGACTSTFNGGGPVSTLQAWFRRGRRLDGPEHNPEPTPQRLG